MRGAFDIAIHRHEIGTDESGVAHGRQKCSIAEILPLATSSTKIRLCNPVIPIIPFAGIRDDLERLFQRFNVEASIRRHVRTCCRLGYARFPLDSLENRQRPALVALTSRLLLRGTNP
jgi:hypothetical protein